MLCFPKCNCHVYQHLVLAMASHVLYHFCFLLQVDFIVARIGLFVSTHLKKIVELTHRWGMEPTLSLISAAVMLRLSPATSSPWWWWWRGLTLA